MPMTYHGQVSSGTAVIQDLRLKTTLPNEGIGFMAYRRKSKPTLMAA